MARIIGGVTTSHIPAIGAAISKGLQNTSYWKPFFDGYAPVRRWLDEVKPDVAVVIYNDHGLSLFLDQIPTFAIGAATQYPNEDSGWGLEELPPVRGDLELSWHLIESLVADEFDITISQEMKVDHGLMVPMMTMWPEAKEWPIRAVPVAVNGPTSTAIRSAMLQAGEGARAGDRVVPGGPQSRGLWHRRHVAPAPG